ncbi:MAG: 50S ribosomal protein L18 [Candidatus Absconditabacterales bacterium]|nr:50S ribosomal protein L18 [Candidatus Absconditabacterales bacterium]
MARMHLTPYERRKRKTNILSKLSSRPTRCLVYRTNKYMYITVTDMNGHTYFSLSDKGLDGSTKVQRAKNLGIKTSSLMIDKGLTMAVFDRNGFLYHGRVRAVCEGLREGGIII